MHARRPCLDFAHANPRWIPSQPEFAHRLNGASSLLPYLEPYLIRVMKLARETLARTHPELLDDVAVFGHQEANHYRLHADYNRVLRAHYPGVEPFERQIERDFERFLRERPLGWNLAYCEGFESSGLIQAELFLEHLDDVLADADPAVRDLWRWHLAEEFEHRTVCHDVLRALSPGWLHRLRVLFFALHHLNGHARRVARHLLAEDRAAGRLAPGWRARLRALRFGLRMQRFALPRLCAVLLPGYDPRRRAMGPAVESALGAYDAR